MDEKEIVVKSGIDSKDDKKEGRYYLEDGLWTHPETGGDFDFHERVGADFYS